MNRPPAAAATQRPRLLLLLRQTEMSYERVPLIFETTRRNPLLSAGTARDTACYADDTFAIDLLVLLLLLLT